MTSEENKANNYDSDIGSQLRNAREARGLSISAAALQSTLDVAIIEKLEENRFSEVGAPVFTRGYLNLYARNLGLDENKINEAFNNLKADPTPKLRITEANAASQNKPFKRNHTGTWIFVIVALLAFALLLQQALDSKSWLVTQINRAFDSTPQEGQKDSNAESEIVLAVGGEPINEKPAAARPLPTSDSAQTSGSDNSQAATSTTTGGASTADASNAAAASAPESDSNNLTLVSLDSDSDDAASSADATTENLTASSEVEIDAQPAAVTGGTLHFNNESWIQVNDASGKLVKIGTFKKGDSIDLPASGAPYKLNIGRPNNVTLTIGASDKPLKNYQQGNSERRFTVDIPNG